MTTYETREYQEYILKKIQEYISQGFNVLVELDCGLGKRYIMHKLVTSIFTSQKIIIFLHSRTSLEETFMYFTKLFSRKNNEINYISSFTNPKLRMKIFDTSRIILTTPQVFSNLLSKHKVNLNDFGRDSIFVINEVDKIIMRNKSNRTLIYPWNNLIRNIISSGNIIGLSGTLRDDFVNIDDDFRVKLR